MHQIWFKSYRGQLLLRVIGPDLEHFPGHALRKPDPGEPSNLEQTETLAEKVYQTEKILSKLKF